MTTDTAPTGAKTWADVARILDGGSHVLAWSTPHAHRGMLPAVRHTTRGGVLRAPHHTVSVAGLVGGVVYQDERRSWRVYPGEITLAHGGVLLLDDAAEFTRAAIVCAAESIRDGVVRLSAGGRVPITLGAACTVLAVSGPCPCGYLGDPERSCVCSQRVIDRYVDRCRVHLAALRPVEITIADDRPAGDFLAELQAIGGDRA